MKSLTYLTIAFTICASTFANESEEVYDDPAHPGKCVYEGLVLSPGEERKVPDRCELLSCSKSGVASIRGCENIIPKGCELGGYTNVHAPYGECCKRKLVCK